MIEHAAQNKFLSLEIKYIWWTIKSMQAVTLIFDNGFVNQLTYILPILNRSY